MYLENENIRTTGLCRKCRDCNGMNRDSGACAQSEGRRSWGLNGYPVAMMYAPLQSFEELYDHATALRQGTLFKALDLPFEGRSVTKGGCGCG